MAEKVRCINPVGKAEEIGTFPLAPRLDTLEGKTICLIANGSFKSNITLSVIAEMLSREHPSATVVPYTEMPRSLKAPAPGKETSERTELVTVLKEKGCEAVISGNGG